MITSIKGFNLQLVIFHGGHSAKLHDAIKDLVFLLREDDYLAFVRTDEKIGRPPKPESDEGEISERYGSSSSLLERPERPNILQKAGKGLTKPPPEEEWEQFSVIDLSGNEFSSLPGKPDCPNLVFLFLQSNRCLEMISDSFFHYMCSLDVVDLSRTGIRPLPPLLFECTGLQALLLRDCKNLDELPPEVGNLGFIEVLDLCGTEVYNLPVEIAKLTHLKRLHVSFYGPADQREYHNQPRVLISSDVILKILALQSLRIHVDPADSRWNNNANALTLDMSGLSNLTHLQFYFPDVEFLRIFIQNSVSWSKRQLGKFKFVVGQDIKRIVSRVPDYIESEYNNHDRCLRFVNGVEIPEEVAGVLERVTAFYLDHHCEIKNLSEFGITKFNELEFCVVRECPKIVEIIDSKERTDSLLPCLQHLSMHYLWKLERLWKGPMPHGSLGRLKILSVHTCHKLETVLTWSMLHCLSNMEELTVEDCASLKKIIEMEEQEVSAGAILPHLKKMKLHYLPQLAILWDGFCPTLEQVSIYGCLKLKKSQYFNLTTTEIEA